MVGGNPPASEIYWRVERYIRASPCFGSGGIVNGRLSPHGAGSGYTHRLSRIPGDERFGDPQRQDTPVGIGKYPFRNTEERTGESSADCRSPSSGYPVACVFHSRSVYIATRLFYSRLDGDAPPQSAAPVAARGAGTWAGWRTVAWSGKQASRTDSRPSGLVRTQPLPYLPAFWYPGAPPQHVRTWQRDGKPAIPLAHP